MNPGDKFRAIRKSNGSIAFQGKTFPDGMPLTCESEADNIITCEEKTYPYEGKGKHIQIFTKYFDIEAI